MTEVLCDLVFAGLIEPKRISKPVKWFGWVVAAEYDESPDELLKTHLDYQSKFPNSEIGFFITFGSSNLPVEELWQPRKARQYGNVFFYICDRMGASTERNVACVLGDVMRIEGKDAVDLFNSF